MIEINFKYKPKHSDTNELVDETKTFRDCEYKSALRFMKYVLGSKIIGFVVSFTSDDEEVQQYIRCHFSFQQSFNKFYERRNETNGGSRIKEKIVR